jgi:4-hydroxy-tetrahydrodipicolinate synthase
METNQSQKAFVGTHTAIITPFAKNGSVDWKAFKFLIDKQINAGVDGIVFVGTTGESPTLTHEEHNEILYKSVELVDGRCAVIHGTGSNATQESLDFAKIAAKAGADAQLVVNPYYNKPTQAGLKAHFEAIADATDLPVILYNIQGRSAINLETDTLLELAEHENIVAVKEASGNFAQITEIIRYAPSDFTVLSGDDGLILSFMAAGGDGLISVISNAMPATTSHLINLCLANKYEAARELYFLIYDLLQDVGSETNPIPIKALVSLLFSDKVLPGMRLPMTPPTAKTLEALKGYLASITEIEAAMLELHLAQPE